MELELPAIFWILVAFLIILLPFAIKDSQKRSAENDEWGKNRKLLMNQIDGSIRQLATTMLGTANGTIPVLLDDIHRKANSRILLAQKEYIMSNGIVSTQDTFSELGLCGVTDTEFVYGLGRFNNGGEAVLAKGSVSQEYTKLAQSVSKEITQSNGAITVRCFDIDPLSATVQSAIRNYQLIQSSITVNAQRILLEHIDYFKEEGTVQYVSDVSGGGVNMQGAIAGAIIAGDAGAVIGSRVGTETRTTINSIDNRKIILVYQEGNSTRSMVIKSYNSEQTMNALRSLIPEKDYTLVALNKEKSKEKLIPTQLSNADELKKFKTLLDEGIITQEEFDAKKKQLLGL